MFSQIVVEEAKSLCFQLEKHGVDELNYVIATQFWK